MVAVAVAFTNDGVIDDDDDPPALALVPRFLLLLLRNLIKSDCFLLLLPPPIESTGGTCRIVPFLGSPRHSSVRKVCND